MFALKMGTTLPVLDVTLKDGTGGPADLTDVDDDEFEVRIQRADTGETVLVTTGAVRYPDDQDDLTKRGKVRVTWVSGNSEAMGEGEMEAEFHGTILGEPIAWPTEGTVNFRVWESVEGEGS